jgi:hypothetical protein
MDQFYSVATLNNQLTIHRLLCHYILLQEAKKSNNIMNTLFSRFYAYRK